MKIVIAGSKWACGVSAYGFAGARWAHCSAAAAHRERHTKREWQRRSKPNTKSAYGTAEQFGKNYRRHVESEYVRLGRGTVRRGPGKIEGSDALVNLAGASIAGSSWSKERKAVLAFEPRPHHPRVGVRD